MYCTLTLEFYKRKSISRTNVINLKLYKLYILFTCQYLGGNKTGGVDLSIYSQKYNDKILIQDNYFSGQNLYHMDMFLKPRSILCSHSVNVPTLHSCIEVKFHKHIKSSALCPFPHIDRYINARIQIYNTNG